MICREGVKALIQGAKLSEIKDRALTDLGRAGVLTTRAHLEPADTAPVSLAPRGRVRGRSRPT